MLEKLYFWKGGNGGSSGSSRVLMILLVVVLLLCGGGAAYWYYYIKLPADDAFAQQQQAAEQVKTDVAAVKKWYEKSLEGADIESGMRVLDEIRRAYLPLSVLKIPVKAKAYSCTLKTCQMTLELEAGAIMTQPEIGFFGKKYKAAFPIKKGKNTTKKSQVLLYDNMAVKLESNPLIVNYKKGKPLVLHDCNDVVSYIKIYNSLLPGGKGNGSAGEIIFKKIPESSVMEKAKRLSGQVKSYDMLAAEWSMELKKNSVIEGGEEINAQIALYKQAYRDAFLIRKIETIKDRIKISGGLVCKA